MNNKETVFTPYEKFINIFSHNGAVGRALHRRQLDLSLTKQTLKLEREYEATAESRFRKRPIDSRSANQLNQQSADSLRFQARSLDDNHDLAASVLNTLVSSIVGTGIRTVPKVVGRSGEKLPEVNKILKDLWNDWIERPETTNSMDWASIQALLVRTWLRDGEAFVRLLTGNVVGLVHNHDVRLSLQLLEADHCPIAYSDDKKRIEQGIQLSTYRRPEAYSFYKQYPTENPNGLSLSGGSLNPSMTAVTLDPKDLLVVSAERVVHLKHVKRLGALRGISVFATAFTRLQDLKEYEEADRIAAKIGSLLALSIHRDNEYRGDSVANIKAREMDMVPGIIFDGLEMGEKVETIKNEKPSAQSPAFRQTQLQAVAGGTYTGASSISKEYAGSYSSQRQELVEQGVIYKQLRNAFISNCIHPIYKEFVKMAVAQGLVPNTLPSDGIRSLQRATHIGGGVPYIDPKKEIEADVVAIGAGIKSLPQVIQERTGRDPDDVLRERVESKEAMDAAGLVNVEKLPEAPAVNPDEVPETEE